MEKKCLFELCLRPAKTKGLCSTHYNQQLRGAALTAVGLPGHNSSQVEFVPKFKCKAGDEVTGGYVVVDIGFREVGVNSNGVIIKRWHYSCKHSCGRTRTFQPHEVLRDKRPCRQCEAGKLRVKESRAVILRHEYNKHNAGARARNLENELSSECYTELVTSPCTYCGREPYDVKILPFGYQAHGREESTLFGGIDRVDNTIGYLRSNCVPCCKICNYMKWTMGADEFLNQCHRIVEHART